MIVLIRWFGAILIVGLISAGWFQDQWVIIKSPSSSVNDSEVVNSIQQQMTVDEFCLKEYWSLCQQRKMGKNKVLLELIPETIVGKWERSWVTNTGKLLDLRTKWLMAPDLVEFLGKNVDFDKSLRLVSVFGVDNIRSIYWNEMSGVELRAYKGYTIKLGRRSLLMRARSSKIAIESIIGEGDGAGYVFDMRYPKGFSLKKN
jgi:hypothetical protein